MKTLLKIVLGLGVAAILLVALIFIDTSLDKDGQRERASADAKYQEEVCTLLPNVMKLSREAGVVYKENLQRAELFVDVGYYRSKIDQKKSLVETWARCKTNGSAKVIDAHSGKVVATYGPLSGFDVVE